MGFELYIFSFVCDCLGDSVWVFVCVYKPIQVFQKRGRGLE